MWRPTACRTLLTPATLARETERFCPPADSLRVCGHGHGHGVM